MNIIVKENYLEMSKYAANIIAKLVQEKPDCVLGLSTGSTPMGVYKELIKMYKEGLDFSGVKTFNLDEYLGVGKDLSKPYDMDQSYARFMHEEFFTQINIKPENVHVPNGLAENTEKACKSYEEEIVNAGGIELQMLGIGGDGHLAFNEPGSSFTSRTRVERLTEHTLNDNYEAFYKKAGIRKENMPHYVITMGVGTILEARQIIMLATGRKKAEIVAKAIEGKVGNEVTASAIQLYNGNATVILDSEAAAMLGKNNF